MGRGQGCVATSRLVFNRNGNEPVDTTHHVTYDGEEGVNDDSSGPWRRGGDSIVSCRSNLKIIYCHYIINPCIFGALSYILLSLSHQGNVPAVGAFFLPPDPSPQSHSSDCDQLLRSTATHSVGGLAAPLIAHIAHGISGPCRQAPVANGIQPASRLLDQHDQGRGPTTVAARPDQEIWRRRWREIFKKQNLLKIRVRWYYII